MSSALREDQGFSLAGSVLENGETDYVLYQFSDETNLTNAIKIGSEFVDTGGPVIHTKLANGNYVLSGYSQIGSQRRLKIICFNETDILWEKRLNGSPEAPRVIHALDDGGILLVGSSNTQTNGSTDAFAIELDQDGNVIWKKGFGSTNNEHFYVAETSFDGLHLVGGNNATFSGTHRPVIGTIDNMGNLVDYNVYAGGGLALFTTVAKSSDMYFAAGYVSSGDRAGIIVAIDQNFEVAWSKRVDIDGYNDNYVSGIGVDDNGFLFVSALAEGANSKVHFLRIDPASGDLITSVTTDQDLPNNEVLTIGGYQIEATESGLLSVSNDTDSGDFVVVRTNECLDNSDCLENAEVSLLNYSLTRTSYSPGERILQNVVDVTEFELTMTEFPTGTACSIACTGDLSVPDASGCVNEPIEFLFDLENEDSEILTYLWEFEDGSNSNLSDLVITTSLAGIQDYTLTIITESGCEYTASGIFTVSDSPELPDIETDINLCEGESFTLDTAEYPEWIITDPDGNEVTVFNTDVPGTYEFTFTSACSTEQIDVSIDQIIVSDFIDFEDQSICIGSDFVIDIPGWDLVASASDIQIILGSNAPVPFVGDPLAFGFSAEGNNTFLVEGSILNCPISETFQVEVFSPPTSFAQNVFNICAGDIIDLDFSDLPFIVLDSGGQIVESVQLTTGGSFIFTGQNACSSFEELIVVNETAIDPPSFGNFGILCEGQDTLAIGFSSTDYDYLWESGSQDPSILVVQSGQYDVLITDTTGICTESFSFQVNGVPFSPSEIFEFPEVEICLEGQTTVNFPPQYGPYAFSDTLVGLTYTATETETLSFTYSDGCHTYQDTLFISVESCLCPIWVPNVFTPNGDGLNDLFKPVLDCEVYDYRLIIFNRWGQEIFQSNDIDVPWRGESPNSDFFASHGVYVYLIVFNQILDGLRVPQEITGNVTLIR